MPSTRKSTSTKSKAPKSATGNDVQVIVIGAGVSGVATAWALRQMGIDSIVLEGRPDRIGGRVWSSPVWKETHVDLGASWVTHMTINPLVEIARANNIKLINSDLLNITLTEANGERLSDEETAETLALYFALLGTVKLNAARRAQAGKPDIPASQEFGRVLKGMQLDDRTRRNVEFFLNLQVTEPHAADLDDLSLYHWDDDYVQMMLAAAVVPAGYVRIVEALAKKLEIRRGHVVSRIAHSADGVIVTTNQGEFKAPYAVVTLPHGVLANTHAKLFSPKLPEWKREAIGQIHTGLSDKFYFLFPKVFWKSNRDILGRVDEEENGRWSTWVNFHRYTKLPILMCFNRTEHAIALEGMTDEEVIDEAMTILRAEYGPGIPRPIRMQRSKWHADPFAQGTLPHVPPGSTGEAFRVLARPVGRVRFAGDSTHAEFNGTVLGAFLSGVREAEKLACLVYGTGAMRAIGRIKH
ncbi:MAG TPA: FAD-dependent oxidoreductase [Candidatus Kapabacteria bacterium]|nr:FAD-dependent oxidoreductase [Candidatus Kapabacteria bacterium]